MIYHGQGRTKSFSPRSESGECVRQQEIARWEVPDAEYIRLQLPVTEVAQKLGLLVQGRWVRCPHDQGHWARIWVRRNRLKCFTCGSRALTTIDLVMNSLQLDVNHAIKWVAARFTVPTRWERITTNLRGTTRHLYRDYPPRKRPPNLEPSIQALRRTAAWASLTPTAPRLADYFLKTIPHDSLVMTTTYREIQAAVHIGNRATLSRALAQIADLGLVETAREASGRDGFGYYAAPTTIRLTWARERFQRSVLGTNRAATQLIGSELNHESDKMVNHGQRGENRHKTEPRRSAEMPVKTKGNFVGEKDRFGEFQRAVLQLAESGLSDFHQISMAACQQAHDVGAEFPFDALGTVKNILGWRLRQGERVQ